jgi:hypothetical protein
MGNALRFALCAAVVVLTSCATPVLTVDDAIVGPHGRTLLVAYVERELMRGVPDSVEGVEVEFRIAGKHVGAATTDKHGCAMIECMLSDRSVDSFTATLAQPHGEQSASGRFFIWTSDRTAIVVDVDGTIYPGDRNHSYLRADDDSEPIENSSDVLTGLGREYDILYLTARPHLASASTRKWLAAHGFPSGPLATARGWRIYFRQERYKRQTLARLRRHVPNLLIGIGDKQLDARAYASNRMLAIHLGGGPEEPADPQTVMLRDWTETRRLFEANRSVLKVPDRLRRHLESDTITDESSGSDVLRPGWKTQRK